jgi:catechol 2,3-dioxygenase-like lactoylglutathione lyase family enzyme
MPSIDIVRLDHVQINVTDLDDARRYYSEVLGLREVPRPESFDFAGCWFRMGDIDVHLVVRPPEPLSDRHFCIRVADVHRAAADLERRGQAVRWDVKYKIPGVDRFFIRDPDGNRIEIQGPETPRGTPLPEGEVETASAVRVRGYGISR